MMVKRGLSFSDLTKWHWRCCGEPDLKREVVLQDTAALEKRMVLAGFVGCKKAISPNRDTMVQTLLCHLQRSHSDDSYTHRRQCMSEQWMTRHAAQSCRKFAGRLSACKRLERTSGLPFREILRFIVAQMMLQAAWVVDHHNPIRALQGRAKPPCLPGGGTKAVLAVGEQRSPQGAAGPGCQWGSGQGGGEEGMEPGCRYRR